MNAFNAYDEGVILKEERTRNAVRIANCSACEFFTAISPDAHAIIERTGKGSFDVWDEE